MELFQEVFPEANPDRHEMKTSKETTEIPSVKKIRVAMCRYDKCQQTFASQPCASAMTWTRSIDESEIDYKGYSLSEALEYSLTQNMIKDCLLNYEFST